MFVTLLPAVLALHNNNNLGPDLATLDPREYSLLQ